ncbi:MAG: hypothetical protein ACKV2Q_32745 [Planctomycetaceae bacterium]
MSDVRTIRVFIASPGDLAVERAAFQQVLEELNAGFGDALDITFEPLGWEDTLASTGRRSQEVINREVDRCDVQKVLDFRKSLEESRQVLYHGFANEAEFQAEVDRHLRAFAKGELPPANAPRDKVLLPLAVLAEVQNWMLGAMLRPLKLFPSSSLVILDCFVLDSLPLGVMFFVLGVIIAPGIEPKFELCLRPWWLWEKKCFD